MLKVLTPNLHGCNFFFHPKIPLEFHQDFTFFKTIVFQTTLLFEYVQIQLTPCLRAYSKGTWLESAFDAEC